MSTSADPLFAPERPGKNVQQAPRRVRDGLISSLGHRPFWSFRVKGGLLDAGGEASSGADELLRSLRERGARIVALGAESLPEALAKSVSTQAELSFEDLLAHLDTTPASVVHVGPDRARDVDAAMQAGMRAVWLHPLEVRPGRGVLRVSSLLQLRQLLGGELLSLRSGSTFHEI